MLLQGDSVIGPNGLYENQSEYIRDLIPGPSFHGVPAIKKPRRWPGLRWPCLIRGVQALDVAPFRFREKLKPVSARPSRARLDGSGTLAVLTVSLKVSVTSPAWAKLAV